MILRFKLYCIAGATALLSAPSSDAFTPATFQRTYVSGVTARPFSLNPDWDNSDFLSSLGGGEEEMKKANDDYEKQKEGRAAMDKWRAKKFAEQSQEQKPATPPAPPQPSAQEKLDGPSPEFFKKMGLTQPPQPLPQAIQPPPPEQQQPPPQQQQYFDKDGNPVNMPMVYDSNGNLVPFNPQQQTQQPAQPQTPPQISPVPVIAEPPLPPKSKGVDSPRPVGFNADAYTMSNTADVYFAQLKQDSKVRKIARMSGDTETANQVFADDTVAQIGESWNQNPYTKEKNLAEARAQIEGTVRLHTQEDKVPETSTGVSYKEKLAAMKAKRAGGGAPTKFVKPAAAPAPPKAEAPVVEAPPKMSAPPKVEQPKTATIAPPMASTPPQPVTVPPPAKVAAVTPAGPTDEDAMRTKVRTLQGLLLKHRGGPGFGAGRLRAPEAQRLEDTLAEVKGALRSEAGMEDITPAAVAAPPAPVVEPKSTVASPIAVAAVSTPPPPTMPAAPVVPAPVQATPSVPQSAATTQPPKAAEGSPDPLAGSVACVEAALRLYKESSPADRQVMVIPLREALMAAASTINKFIAESELNAHKAAMEAGPPPVESAAQPMMGFPTTYAVTKPGEESVQSTESNSATATATASTDAAENQRKLEDAYSALLKAGGEGGKLGLKNISGDEADALADKLVAMRGVLLDELNNGD